MINPSRSDDQHGERLHRRVDGERGRSKTVSIATRRAPVVRQDFDSLESCEQAMAEGFQRFAAALTTVRDNRLYREAGYASFDNYCTDRLGMTRKRADQIAKAHFTVKTLPTACRQLISNESQARALSEVPKSERSTVLKEVAKSGPITGPRIREAGGKSKPETVDAEFEPSKEEPKPLHAICPTCQCQ